MKTTVTIRRTPAAIYPSATDAFGPGPANAVYSAVRDCLEDAGLDRGHQRMATWNPFGSLVRPGGRVFVLCNFVYHSRGGREGRRQFAAKCTHASVVRPVVDYALAAVGRSGVVEVGNAPIQGADWDALMRDTELDRLMKHYTSTNAPVRALDLRKEHLLCRMDRDVRRTNAMGVAVDLGRWSLLESIDGNRDYRVLQYDPERTATYHGPGRHVYQIAENVLVADLIISVPKLKTHQKVGLTCALKGSVGAITEKHCLAHHRHGGPHEGGDEYPDAGLVPAALSWLGDLAWRGGRNWPGRVARLAEQVGRATATRMRVVSGGSWPGNDTCWRMALDIARCLRFADTAGTLHDEPQRHHIVVVDGVIGGQGEGPLSPDPVDSRCVMYSPEPFAADLAAANVMGLAGSPIRIVSQAPTIKVLPVTSLNSDDVVATLDGAETPIGSLHSQFPPFAPPRAWKNGTRADSQELPVGISGGFMEF
jgi:uncharacterized protein (DUF362 family)